MFRKKAENDVKTYKKIGFLYYFKRLETSFCIKKQAIFENNIGKKMTEKSRALRIQINIKFSKIRLVK